MRNNVTAEIKATGIGARWWSRVDGQSAKHFYIKNIDSSITCMFEST